MSKLSISIISILFILLSSNDSFAFDDNKSGFVIGGGLGAGIVRNTATGFSENKISAKTDFLIGWGLSNGQTLITWSSKVYWYSGPVIGSNSELQISGTAGLGITHFLNPGANSIFINSVVGYNSWSVPLESTLSSQYGFGFSLGIGREFANKWIIGVDANWGKPVSGLTNINLGVYISRLWY